MFPELWTEERLDPHLPKAVFLVQFEDATTYVDISETMDLKVKALEAHRCQIGNFEVGTFIRERNSQIGEKAGYEYAEGYRLLRTGQDD
jgi:LmbE family N-acetylglucosaminyl deacetylase